MRVADLLESLKKIGIRLFIVDGELKIAAPQKLLIPDLLQIIKTHRRSIIDTLISMGSTNSDNERNDSKEKVDYVDYASEPNLFSSSLNPQNPAKLGEQSTSITADHNLIFWLDQLKQCISKQSVFDLLKQFQPLPWTDEERAAMAHQYHRQLSRVRL